MPSGITRQCGWIVVLPFSFWIAAGPGGGLPVAELRAQDAAESKQRQDEAEALRQELREAYAEAVRSSVRMLFLGIAAILLAGCVLGLVLMYAPSKIRTPKPFDPEKERRETRDGPLQLW